MRLRVLKSRSRNLWPRLFRHQSPCNTATDTCDVVVVVVVNLHGEWANWNHLSPVTTTPPFSLPTHFWAKIAGFILALFLLSSWHTDLIYSEEGMSYLLTTVACDKFGRRAFLINYYRVVLKHSDTFWKPFSKCSTAYPKIALWHNISASHSRSLAGMFLHYSVYTTSEALP